MSALIQGGSTEYVDGRVQFSGASDIQFPFNGSLVIPRAGSNEPADIDRLSHGDFPLAALIHPRTDASGARRFPSLYTITGQVYSSDQAVIFLVADNTPFSANLEGSWSWPYIIAIELSGSIDLPERDPVARADEFVIRPLLDVLPASGSLNGTVIAFDKAGMEIEADAALRSLGMTGISSAPEATDISVQLVDILGQPIATDALTRRSIQFSPDLTSPDSTRMTYRVNLGSDPPELTLRLTDPGSSEPAYLSRNLWVGVWPGAGGLLKQLSSGSDVTFDLSLGVAGDASPPRFLRLCVYHPAQVMQTEVGGTVNENGVFMSDPPTQAANNMYLSSAKNKVEVFNDGLSFFADFEASVRAAIEEPEGQELYLSNWVSNPHLHLLGSLSAYGIDKIDVDSAAVNAVLSRLFASITSVPLAPIDPPPSPPPPDPADPVEPEPATPPDPNDPTPIFLAFAQPAEEDADVSQIRVPLHLEVLREASPAVPEASISKGFTREAGPIGLRLDHEGDRPGARTIIARWKNPFGEVLETRTSLPAALDPADLDTSAPIQHVLQTDLETIAAGQFALGVDESVDPASATLVQKVSRTALSAEFESIRPVPDSVLVMNLTSGTFSVFELQSNAASVDVVLGVLPATTTALDSIAIALLRLPDETNLTDNLITGFKQLAYDAQAQRTAQIPFSEGELGGLLRRAIASGVTVRALYWDQSLANLATARDTYTGDTNNAKISATVNRQIAGNRGWAVMDRTHRAFGSLHQKATVIVDRGVPGSTEKTKIKSWVGGIDLSLGRWDTEKHAGTDPDRQANPWWDIQTSIEGLGAVDVLRNFKQRWEGLRVFKELAVPRLYAPTNNEPGINNALDVSINLPDVHIDLEEVKKPNAMVQITRTICPRSPFAEHEFSFPQSFVGEAGELGSFAAYKKAIECARRFVIINEQYFYNTELALLLHERLLDPEGLEFLILVVPKNLAELAAIDPMFFKLREKTLQVLMYGGTYTGPDDPAEPRCGKISANVTGTDSTIAHKVAVLYTRNQDTDVRKQPVYVHSKHMIIDDAWMIIGSSNINYRSMTFDTEINASIVGQQLYDGTTQVVQEQRIDLIRRMLGLPASYAPLLREPHAMFMLVKSLYEKDTNPGHVLHPNEPYCQHLHADYVKQNTDALGNPVDTPNFEFLASLSLNDPMIDFIGCNVLDTDGRDTEALLAPLGVAVSSWQPAYARLALSFDTAANALALTALSEPGSAFVSIDVTGVVLDTNGNPIATEPRPWQRVSLVNRSGAVVPHPDTGELVVTVQTWATTTIRVRLIREDGSDIGAQAEHVIEALSDHIDSVLPGTLRRVDLEIVPI